jgi:hypothetical protein
MPHGTASRYGNDGCRCAPCREAYRIRQKAYRDERTERLRSGLVEVRHGELGTYLNWGCRCSACTEAHRLAAREYRARKRAEL